MDFVDEVHLVAPFAGRVLHVVQQFAGVIDPGAGRGVHFNQVHETAFVEFATRAAFAAGAAADPALAVETFGEHARQRGFAYAAGAREEVGVVQAVAVQRVRERTQHMALPDHLGKITRTPFPGENQISHGNAHVAAGEGGDPASHTSAPAVTTTAASFRT